MPRLDYEKVNWEDAPSDTTPLSAENLNNMDNGIAALYADVGDLEDAQATIITKDIVPTEVYDEDEGAYISAHEYAIGDVMILSDSNYQALDAIDIGDEIIPLPEGMTVADIPQSVWESGEPNVAPISLGDAVVKAVSDNVQQDQDVVKTSDIKNNITTSTATSNKVLDARQGKVLGSLIAYINSMSDLAVNDYSVGKYLIIEGLLYRVIQHINQYDPFQVGVNIVQTTVADELKSLSEAMLFADWTTCSLSNTYSSGSITYCIRGKLMYFRATIIPNRAITTAIGTVAMADDIGTFAQPIAYPITIATANTSSQGLEAWTRTGEKNFHIVGAMSSGTSYYFGGIAILN